MSAESKYQLNIYYPYYPRSLRRVNVSMETIAPILSFVIPWRYHTFILNVS